MGGDVNSIATMEIRMEVPQKKLSPYDITILFKGIYLKESKHTTDAFILFIVASYSNYVLT